MLIVEITGTPALQQIADYAESVALATYHGDRVDLDEIIRRGHLTDLDHRGGRRRRLEIVAARFVDQIEMLHVAYEHVDPADILQAAAGFLNRGFDVLTHLTRLRLDIADARNAAVG